MAVVDVLNTKAEKVSQLELDDAIFNVPLKPSVVHQVVTMQLARRRRGTASVRRRSDVRGSGRKLFRQKGTGRARRGNVKSPLLRGGGVAFGPSPRSYDFHIPKKVRRLALKMALSSKLQAEQLLVVDAIDLARIKTRDVVVILEALKLTSALIVTDEKNEHLELSTRNIPRVTVLRSEGLNVYDVLNHRHLVLLEPSVKRVVGRLAA